jgi:AbrB family looped-hinge helix DNA binding protein
MAAFMPGRVVGTTTVGARGQVVIPSDARKELGLKSGDKLIVMARSRGHSISLIPVDTFNEFLERASKNISAMEKQVSKETKRKKRKKKN